MALPAYVCVYVSLTRLLPPTPSLSLAQVILLPRAIGIIEGALLIESSVGVVQYKVSTQAQTTTRQAANCVWFAITLTRWLLVISGNLHPRCRFALKGSRTPIDFVTLTTSCLLARHLLAL